MAQVDAMKTIRIYWIVGASLLTVAFAQATLRLTINAPAITVNGKVCVPLEALKKAGTRVTKDGNGLNLSFQTASGGANQRVSLEARRSTLEGKGEDHANT